MNVNSSDDATVTVMVIQFFLRSKSFNGDILIVIFSLELFEYLVYTLRLLENNFFIYLIIHLLFYFTFTFTFYYTQAI